MSGRALFEAWWHGVDHIHIATFFDRATAEAFCREINDECQADVMEVEMVALIDRHGYRCAAIDYFAHNPCPTCKGARVVSDGAHYSGLGKDYGGMYCPDCT